MTAQHAPRYPLEVPEFVRATQRFAERLGFDNRPQGNRAGSNLGAPSSCIDEMGSLLCTLASACPGGRIAEIGTGGGVGAAWIASGLAQDASLVTVELDPELASAVRAHFRDDARVSVETGDWREVLPPSAPFDLLFLDGGGPNVEAAAIAGLVRVGGIVLIDDLTPEALWPDAWRGKPDPKRELAFRSGCFRSHEVGLRADVSALVMVRIS